MKEIVVLGDIILDKFSYGKVNRLNPESPVPLMKIEKEELKLGGASNVASNIASLGEETQLIGVLGDDQNGRSLEKFCQQQNIQIKKIVNGYPTTTKQRFIETTYRQQLLRVDFEEIANLTPEQINQIVTIIDKGSCQYLIISDYKKGVISEELVEKIKLIAFKKGIKILVDTKLQNISFFKDVFLIKPNFKEFCEMIGQKVANEDQEIGEYGKEFVENFKVNLVVTRGEKGCSLITKEGKVYHLPTQTKEVFDVTGAGDTFIGALAVALNRGYDLPKALEIGNKASGIVVGKLGTATVKKEELDF